MFAQFANNNQSSGGNFSWLLLSTQNLAAHTVSRRVNTTTQKIFLSSTTTLKMIALDVRRCLSTRVAILPCRALLKMGSMWVQDGETLLAVEPFTTKRPGVANKQSSLPQTNQVNAALLNSVPCVANLIFRGDEFNVS